MIGLALFGIVHRASGTIEDQREALRSRIAEAERIGEQNRHLRLRVERASARGAELNERLLRRISADLHDGPAQLISLAALRLGGVAQGRTKGERRGELEVVREALNEAIADIRSLSHGLSLPQIETLSVAEVIRKAAAAHERHTASPVRLTVEGQAPPTASGALKICVFRFVQESLNNAFRHAGGQDQAVDAQFAPSGLTLSVKNGLPEEAGRKAAEPREGGLGLSGMRERVESLGGRFTFTVTPGREARTAMVIGWDVGGGHER